MQQASIAKVEAHRDKVSNQVATTTKLRFLNEEAVFLNDFKESLEELNQLAKPTPHPQHQIPKIARKIEKQFLRPLEEDVLFTRREISLEEINDDLRFEAKVAEAYEEKIGECNGKLEHMEKIVQESEDRRKSKEKDDFSSSAYFFKSAESRRQVEDFLAQKQKIKDAFRRRLLLLGKIATIQQQSCQQLLFSLFHRHTYNTYHFLAHHQHHYRNKSSDNSHHLKSKMSKSPKQRHKIHLRNSSIEAFQAEVFTEQIHNTQNCNAKIQASINLLKEASSQREDQKLLEFLNQTKDLQREQSIAREVIAYQRLSQRFQQKLEKCSYKWVFDSKAGHRPIQFKEHHWEEERIRINRKKFIKRPRPKSADKRTIENAVPLVIAQGSKTSNAKTNCSLQINQ